MTAARANRRYRPEFYPGTLTLFKTADQSKYPPVDLRLVMRQYAKETQIIPLPGNRTGLFARPVVDALARQLQICLDRAEGNSHPACRNPPPCRAGLTPNLPVERAVLNRLGNVVAARIFSEPARSAIVRATFKIRS